MKKYTIEVEQESNENWLAKIPEIPNIIDYGKTSDEAVLNVLSLALWSLSGKDMPKTKVGLWAVEVFIRQCIEQATPKFINDLIEGASDIDDLMEKQGYVTPIQMEEIIARVEE